MTPIVVASALHKRYARRHAVRDVSFTVDAGSVLGLLGPNGSGKSTILRMLTGYQVPTSGSVTVAGHDVAHDGLAARRHIGYVPEDIPLYLGMTVRDFLAFMATVRGVRQAESASSLSSVCSRLSLQGIADMPIGKLSRGFRQRVAIAQALLGDPPLLVLDEPTNGLDPRQIIEMRHLVRALARRHTIIVTSHILTEIEQVATHVAILLDGNLLTCERLEHGGTVRRWAFELSGPSDKAVRDCIKSLKGIVKASVAAISPGNTMELHVEVADPSVASSIAAALVSGGFELRSMTPSRSNLEALFMAATSNLEPRR